MITVSELTTISLFSDLTDEQLAFVASAVEDIHLQPGEYSAREGEERALFIVVSGLAELTKDVHGTERVIGERMPGDVYGEVPMMLGTLLPASHRAVEASRVLRMDAGSFFALVAMAPQVAATIGAAALRRAEWLKEIAAEPVTPDMTVIGPLVDPRVHEARTFLHRNRISFETIDTDAPEHSDRRSDHVPVIELKEGGLLLAPTVREIALACGLSVVAKHDSYDVIIIGGGPTGLTAAVNSAAEGLSTLVVERLAPGGQAGTSTRIENYTGFPFGISGDDLAAKAMRQAQRLGAEIIVTRTVEHMNPITRTVTLDGGEALTSKVVVVTSGVEWRRVSIPDIERFVGSGVYYGAARSDSRLAHGSDVFIIGAGNSAGQAALFFARHSTSVTLIVRGDSLTASMSAYLIEQITSNPTVTVRTRSEVVGLYGPEDLESIDILDKSTGTTMRQATTVLFVMIGADAQTTWLPPEVCRDEYGFIVTGPHAKATGSWAEEREPLALETTVPGVFAAGDVRSGSVKRVAAGVGEGGMVIAYAHQYMALTN